MEITCCGTCKIEMTDDRINYKREIGRQNEEVWESGSEFLELRVDNKQGEIEDRR